MRRIGRRKLVLSLVVTGALAGAGAWWAAPMVVHYQRLHQLESNDDSTRRLALDYLALHPQAARAASDQLLSSSPEVGLDILHAMHAAGVLDEVELIKDVHARLATLPDDGLLSWVGVLQQWGRWSAKQVPLPVYLRWLGLLAQETDAEARLLAADRLADLHAQAHEPAINPLLANLLADDDDRVRYAGLLASAELAGAAGESDNRAALETLVAKATDDDNDELARDAWLLLGQLDPVYGFQADWRAASPRVAPAILFAALRTNPQDATPALEALADAKAAPGTRMIAAHMLKQQGYEPFDADWSALIQRDAGGSAVLDEPTVDMLQPLFSHEDSRVRDAACVVAAQHFREAQNEALIRELLIDFNDEARLSGAMLAGLTGLQPSHQPSSGPAIEDLLLERSQNEARRPVRQMMRLGLWMQGRLTELADDAPLLLAREDLPTSTVLLALLHRKRNEALDYLLTPRREESYPLREWLCEYQWSRVLARCLPVQAPRVELDAPADLQQFQIDVLRNWWLIKRGQSPQ